MISIVFGFDFGQVFLGPVHCVAFWFFDVFFGCALVEISFCGLRTEPLNLDEKARARHTIA